MIRWRRIAVFISWAVAAGWGLYYLVALASSSVAFIVVAVLHFVAGYVWGLAVMAQPMTIRLALVGTFFGGLFSGLALGVGTGEFYFAWAGPLAAAALSDTTNSRNLVYSGAAFVMGYLLISVAL